MTMVPLALVFLVYRIECFFLEYEAYFHSLFLSNFDWWRNRSTFFLGSGKSIGKTNQTFETSLSLSLVSLVGYFSDYGPTY